MGKQQEKTKPLTRSKDPAVGKKVVLVVPWISGRFLTLLRTDLAPRNMPKVWQVSDSTKEGL